MLTAFVQKVTCANKATPPIDNDNDKMTTSPSLSSHYFHFVTTNSHAPTTITIPVPPLWLQMNHFVTNNE